MNRRNVRVAIATVLLLTVVIASLAGIAQSDQDIYPLNGSTSEGGISTYKIVLEGDEVLWAYFNFSLKDDILYSEPDSFVFTVSNADDPTIRQSMSATTDPEGYIDMSLPFTLPATPVWNVEVRCTEAGDRMLGPVVRESDSGNEWLLRVEYAYELEGPDGVNNDGRGYQDGSGGEPLLVRAFQANLVGIAGLSLLVVALCVRGRSREAGLVPQYALASLLLLDAFVSLPIALVINLEENGAMVSSEGFGPEWLGNLAILLLVVWVVPFAVPARRVLTSGTTRAMLTRFVGASAAKAARKLGRRLHHDTLSFRRLSDLLAGVGLASVVVAVLILLL